MRRSTKVLAALAVAAGGAGYAGHRKFTTTVASWATNPDPCGGDPLGLPDHALVEVATTDGATLRGVRFGNPNGPTVLMIHGFIETGAFWGPVARELVDTHDLILVDQRGHGRSDRGTLRYEPSTLATDVRAWIDGLELTGVTLVGHSMGGVSAMSYATHEKDHASEHVAALVLVATLARPIRNGPVPSPAMVRRGLVFADRAMGRPDLGLFLLRDVWGQRPARAALEVTRDAFLATALESRVDAAAMLSAFDLRDLLPGIELPTRVVAGSHDGLTALELNQEIADLIPGATIDVVPTRGHMLMFEAPERVVAAVRDATAAKTAAA